MSIAKVAEKAGVSQATVSYVINGKPGVSTATIKHVNEVIAELGYVPRPRSASKRRMRDFALIMTGGTMSQSPLNSQLFEATHREVERANARLIPIRLSATARMDEALSACAGLDGAILFYRHLLDSFRGKLPVPAVTMLGRPDPALPLACDHIEPDNERIGALAARYLADRDHQRIAMINPSTKPHAAMDARGGAFIAAARTRGVEAREIHIALELELFEHPERLSDAHPLARWIAAWKTDETRPTGIFVPSDAHLAIVFEAMARAAIRPGRDVDFIGCNNVPLFLRGMSPRPATIDINPDQIARSAIDQLVRRIECGTAAPHVTCRVEPTLLAGA